MSPDELAAALAGLVDGGVGAVEWGGAVVDVPATSWGAAATAARDTAGVELTFFDLLTAVDLDPADGADLVEGGAARLQVVLHLWSQRHRHHAVLRTEVAGRPPALASLSTVFPGADWAEREVHEMFGLQVDGHPGLDPLLLPDGYDDVHPLRKSFVLASRVVRPWPGAKDPADSDPSARRRPVQPFGVPEPGTWGPDQT